jgi:hypothetical protein
VTECDREERRLANDPMQRNAFHGVVVLALQRAARLVVLRCVCNIRSQLAHVAHDGRDLAGGQPPRDDLGPLRPRSSSTYRPPADRNLQYAAAAHLDSIAIEELEGPVAFGRRAVEA